MGGRGSGGRRPGAGRKPKTVLERAIDGNAGHRVLVHPSAPSTVIAEPEAIAAPDTLTKEEKAIWVSQAPHAVKNRTLTAATVMAFTRYCGVAARELKERQSSACDGPNHERMLKRINALELQFGLVPCGKAIYQGEPEKPANPLDKFLNRRRS